MLVLDVALVPHGDWKRAKKIASGALANIGGSKGEYDYAFVLREPNPIYQPKPVEITGIITNHDRESSVFALIEQCFNFGSNRPITPVYYDILSRHLNN